MHYKTLIVSEPHQHISQVTLNRPEVRNAINLNMMNELLHFWQTMSTETSVRCIIITGTTPAFCSGADLKARQGMDTATWLAQHAILQRAMRTMINCPIPIIAAVNGAAFGGGLELALAADFIYASNNAQFGQSETKLGIMPGAMGTQHLPRACGSRRAKELCFTGQTFSAKQAAQWDVVNTLCHQKDLLNDVLSTAKQIAMNAPLANRQAKAAINVAYDLDIEQGYTFEVNAYKTLLSTKDRLEGITAFNEKRSPHFKGE